MIEKHDGEINLESEFGKGTKTNIYIKKIDEKLHKSEEREHEQNTNYRGR